MSIYKLLGTITGTSPASAITTVLTGTVADLNKYDEIHVEADLLGGTGGTLDVYIQRKIASGVWRDWAHFAQLASGAAAIKHSLRHGVASGIVVTGGGNDATPGVGLAANAQVGGHPGTEIRVVCVAGASTSAGAAQTIRVLGLKK